MEVKGGRHSPSPKMCVNSSACLCWPAGNRTAEKANRLWEIIIMDPTPLQFAVGSSLFQKR